MAEPTLSQVHIDAALTDFATAYFNADASFAWRALAPVIQSPKQSNKFFTYSKADTMRTDAQKRAPGTRSALRNWNISNDNFFADVVAVSHAVSEQIAANADDPIDPEQDAVRLLTHDLMLKMEVDSMATFFTTSVWGTDVVGTTNFTKWGDAAATPIEDLATGIRTVLQNTGQRPNTLVLGAATWYDGLLNHPDIIARLPDNSPRIATAQFVGNLLDIDRVVVASAIRNTAEEGATASYSFIGSDNALLAYVAPNPGPRTATAAATFMWTGLTGAGGGIRAKRFDIPQEDAFPLVEVDCAYDFKVVGSDLGYFYSDCI